MPMSVIYFIQYVSYSNPVQEGQYAHYADGA